MSFILCYVDANGNVKYEESKQWEEEYEETGMHVDDENLLPWEQDDASEWLEKHSDGIRGLEALEAMNGKGDTPRPIDKEKFDKNHAAIFGEKPKHVCRKFIRDDRGISRCYHCYEIELDQMIDLKKHREDLSNR